MIKTFEMTHRFFTHAIPEVFTEYDAPDWLSSVNTIKGSTMDARWFWERHVLTLGVGEEVLTEFRKIRRIK